MLIGIDAHTIGQQATGNETYVANLIAALGRLDGDRRYRLFVIPAGKELSATLGPNFEAVPVAKRGWIRWSWSLPYRLMSAPVDLLHVQYVAPPFWRGPLIATIHDVSYAFMPGHLKRHDRWRVERLFPPTARRSARIITGTSAAKDTIVDHLQVPPQKIVVVPYGINDRFRPIADEAQVAVELGRRGLEPGYILFVGNLQPRKNLVTLLKAFARLKRKARIDEKLVVVGNKGWLYKEVLAAPVQLGIADNVIFTGYVPDEELPLFYNGAKLFVFPSLHEGFGFPPLEAMACGVPVVSSSAPALPEVLGDAAVFVAPDDAESIADGMLRLLDDGRLRQDVIHKGLKRAAGFSWLETARKTVAVYDEVLAEVNESRHEGRSS